MDKKKPHIIVLTSVTIVLSMLGLVYYSPSLYQLFCEITGINGTPKKTQISSAEVTSQDIKIVFDSNLAPDLSLKFFPEQRSINIKIGETKTAYYIVENLYTKDISTMSVVSVEPEGVAKYVNKIECFCFSQQDLLAKELKKMPIVFFISPEILQDPDYTAVKEIYFSYTMFES